MPEYTQEAKNKGEEKITVEDRRFFSMNRVKGILGFDEDYVSIETESGRIGLEGESLRIENMLKGSGEILITGKITAILFEEGTKEKRGFFGGRK